MEKRFYIEPGQAELPVTVAYDFVSEQGDLDGDGFQISLEIDGPTDETAYIYVIAHGRELDPPFRATMTPLAAIPSVSLPAGDFPLHHTDWQTAAAHISLPTEVSISGGMATLRFAVFDQYVPQWEFYKWGDSALLIDNIRFR